MAIYIDDLINLHKSYNKCKENTYKIVELLQKLGFTIHPTKSSLEPSQIKEFLGFIINSVEMTIQLTQVKKRTIAEMCSRFLTQPVTIRDVARLIGKFTSSCLGVKFGPLHYRYLDRDKTRALELAKGNYNAPMVISKEGKADIHWWLENVMTSSNHIRVGNPTLTITTDACFTGWGGTIGSNSTHGLWHAEELYEDIDINILELKAILFSLMALVNVIHDTHVKILTDNTTAP